MGIGSGMCSSPKPSQSERFPRFPARVFRRELSSGDIIWAQGPAMPKDISALELLGFELIRPFVCLQCRVSIKRNLWEWGWGSQGAPQEGSLLSETWEFCPSPFPSFRGDIWELLPCSHKHRCVGRAAKEAAGPKKPRDAKKTRSLVRLRT